MPSKQRKYHFVIHNQGPYSQAKKEALLGLLKSKFTNMEGYLIAQEVYPDNRVDTHLQGNLFFKHGVHFNSLLKVLQSSTHKEERTELGLKYRTELDTVRDEGRAYNYMMNPKKDGGDPNPLCDNTQLDKRRDDEWMTQQLQLLIRETLVLQNQTDLRNRTFTVLPLS